MLVYRHSILPRLERGELDREMKKVWWGRVRSSLIFPSSFIVGGWSGVLAGVDDCGEYHSRRLIEWHEMELLGLSFISLGLCFILERGPVLVLTDGERAS